MSQSLDSFDDALAAGLAALSRTDNQTAYEAFCAAWRFDPTNAEALAGRGEAETALGMKDQALADLRAAVSLDPGRVDWRLLLAKVAEQDEAEWLLRDIVSHRPGHAEALTQLADLLTRRNATEEAVDFVQQGVLLDGESVPLRMTLASLLINAERAHEAVPHLTALLRRDPDNADCHELLGNAWMALGESEKAEAAYLAAAERSPDDATELRERAAAAGRGLRTLPRSMVRTLFEQYADAFDAELVGKLGYVAPGLLREALASEGALREGGLDVLDLGCGTGLMGAELSGSAASLTGVDLSPGMIAKACERAIYDDLAADDVVSFLSAAARDWDLIVAADVLVYIGDLLPLFQAATQRLRPSGLFAATVERGEGDGFELGATRRFTHSEDYISRTARAAGLSLRRMERVVPRYDRGQPVDGLLFILER